MRLAHPWAIWPRTWHSLGQRLCFRASLLCALVGSSAHAQEQLSPPDSGALAKRSAPLDDSSRKLELGLEASAISRPSGQDGVAYELGPRWSAHATVLLLDQLGMRLTGGMEYHDVSIASGGLGTAGQATGEPDLRGPHVMGQLQPMIEIAPRFDAYALLGVGWQRFTASPISISEPSPLTISERSGVLVELPFALGARYALVREHMAVALYFAFSAPVAQSGSLFDGGAGASQGLRQDTGKLVRVDAFPHFESAKSAGISFDFYL